MNKDEQDLPLKQKPEQRERRLQLQRTSCKRREQNPLAEQTSEEAQKRLNAERK